MFCYCYNMLPLETSQSCYFHCISACKTLPFLPPLFFWMFLRFHNRVKWMEFSPFGICIHLWKVEDLQQSFCVYLSWVKYVVTMTYHRILLRSGIGWWTFAVDLLYVKHYGGAFTTSISFNSHNAPFLLIKVTKIINVRAGF